MHTKVKPEKKSVHTGPKVANLKHSKVKKLNDSNFVGKLKDGITLKNVF